MLIKNQNFKKPINKAGIINLKKKDKKTIGVSIW